MSDFAGSLKLLEDGARALTSAGPFLLSLGLRAAADSAAPSQSAAHARLIHANYSGEYMLLEFMSNVPLHVDTITARANQSAQAVGAALLTLALENVVVEG